MPYHSTVHPLLLFVHIKQHPNCCLLPYKHFPHKGNQGWRMYTSSYMHADERRKYIWTNWMEWRKKKQREREKLEGDGVVSTLHVHIHTHCMASIIFLCLYATVYLFALHQIWHTMRVVYFYTWAYRVRSHVHRIWRCICVRKRFEFRTWEWGEGRGDAWR